MKESYSAPELELLRVSANDLIAVSSGSPYETEDNEGYSPVFRP